jgi:hypothetical protein
VRHYVQQQGFTVEAHTSAIFFLWNTLPVHKRQANFTEMTVS